MKNSPRPSVSNWRRDDVKDKLKGKVEELKGKATGDRVEEVKGKGRQAVGGVKQTAKATAYDAEHPRRDK